MKRTFNAWMEQVDAIIELRIGLTSLDLPDYAYANAYESGQTPVSTATAVIRASREF